MSRRFHDSCSAMPRRFVDSCTPCPGGFTIFAEHGKTRACQATPVKKIGKQNRPDRKRQGKQLGMTQACTTQAEGLPVLPV